MTTLALLLCWGPPLLHGYWLIGHALLRRFDASTAMLIVDEAARMRAETSWVTIYRHGGAVYRKGPAEWLTVEYRP